MDFFWRGMFDRLECCCTADSTSNERALPWELHGAGGPASLPPGPHGRAAPTFGTSEVAVILHGDPLHAGVVLLDETEEMMLAIHENGFSLTQRLPDGQQHAIIPQIVRPWSPFTLVEKLELRPIFKLTVYRGDGDDRMYFFASPGDEAYRERDLWCDEISDAIRNVSYSLFPRHAISVRPLASVDSTSSRIMAGYLLQCLACDNVSLYYCELHAYVGKRARLAIYEDQWCEREVACIHLTEETVLSSRRSAHYCAVFGTDSLCFCARSPEEKELWLRALSNVKVKIMFEAPDVDISTAEGVEMLDTFRAAVEEMVLQLPSAVAAEASVVPILPPVQRSPWPLVTRGDDEHNPVPSAQATPYGSPVTTPVPSRGLRMSPVGLRGDQPMAENWPIQQIAEHEKG